MIKIGYNNSNKHYGSLTHYEKPDRVNFCVSRLKDEFKDKDYFIESKNRNIYQLIDIAKLIHSSQYIDKIRDFQTNNFICRKCNKKQVSDTKKTINKFIIDKEKCINCDNLFDLNNLYCYATPDTFYTGNTFYIAMDAIGVIVDLIDEMKFNTNIYSFALVRPPGHHCNNDPNGFCIFNNAMIGAKYAQKLGFNKVLILDVDFHHGDGTQELLELNPDPNISFISIHGYGEAVYPGTGSKSNLENNILNIPFNISPHPESRDYITDEFYQANLDSQVFPFIKEKNPNLIIVSLGFDAHKDDPLEGMNISDLTYIYMTLKLKELNIPTMFLLEGGYNIKTIGRVIPQMINLLK
jgi:acetoin utilization deacetylase AcuC-like enzyme